MEAKLKQNLAVTAFGIILFAALFHFSEVMGNIYSMDLVGTAKKILTLYLMAAVLYVAVTYVIYTIRYAKAKKRLQLFLEYLDCLDQDGEEETAERK